MSSRILVVTIEARVGWREKGGVLRVCNLGRGGRRRYARLVS